MLTAGGIASNDPDLQLWLALDDQGLSVDSIRFGFSKSQNGTTCAVLCRAGTKDTTVPRCVVPTPAVLRQRTALLLQVCRP